MGFATIEHTDGQLTIVNSDQITYIRQDTYGTAIHFTSGEHIICPLEVESLMATLGGKSAEHLLIRPT